MTDTMPLMRLMMRAKRTRFAPWLEDDELPSYNREQVPKQVWTYWDNGETNAPDIVKLCLEQWRIANPDWKITVLEEESLPDYIDTGGIPDNVTQTRRSNIIRMRLLKSYGGVWADATTYCQIPLDNWLQMVSGTGFFAFFRETRYRGIATWFLAAQKDSYLLNRWHQVYEPHLQRYGERYKWAVQNSFEYLLRFEPAFRREFSKMPKISAQPSLEIERWMRDADRWPRPVCRDIPIYKLSWKTEMPVKDVLGLLNAVSSE